LVAARQEWRRGTCIARLKLPDGGKQATAHARDEGLGDRAMVLAARTREGTRPVRRRGESNRVV